MKVWLVMGCYVDLTDPEPNCWVNNICSTKEKAEEKLNELKAEESGSWFGMFEREVDGDEGIVLTDEVDMEMFC